MRVAIKGVNIMDGKNSQSLGVMLAFSRQRAALLLCCDAESITQLHQAAAQFQGLVLKSSLKSAAQQLFSLAFWVMVGHLRVRSVPEFWVWYSTWHCRSVTVSGR